MAMNIKKSEWVLAAAEILLRLGSIAQEDITVEMIKSLSLTSWAAIDQKTPTKNIKSCETFKTDRVENTLLCPEVAFQNIGLTSLAGEIEDHRNVFKNTKYLNQEQPELERDSQALFSLRAQTSAARHPMHTSFRHEILGIARNYVEL